MSDRTALLNVLRAFIGLWHDRPRQRTPGWFRLKADQAGSSDLKKFEGGLSPAAKISFVRKIAGLVPKRPFCGVPLDWGTLLEPFLERYVELDCGLELLGTDISVPAPEDSGLRGYHSNSPDGYGVVEFYQPPGVREWKLLTTELAEQEKAEGCERRHEIVLFEFKNSITRIPDGRVPPYYLTQLWSGMTLAPLTQRAVFVDGAHRRCSLDQLGPGPGYDRSFHPERKRVSWGECPVAWGFVAVYSPGAGAPPEVRRRVDSVSGEVVHPFDAAYQMWTAHFRRPFRDGPDGRPEAVDFGKAHPSMFARMMRFCVEGHFRTGIAGLACPDGRGDSRLGSPEGIQEAVAAAAADAPPHHFLLGVLPLKLMRVDYVVEERNDAFVRSIRDELVEVCEAGRRIRGSLDPAAEFEKYSGSVVGGAAKKREAPPFWDDSDDEFADAPVRE